MNQSFDEERISAYLDDELSDEDRRDVERLLAERPEAQRLLDELRGLRENLQLLPTYQLQADFGAAVLRRAERELLRSSPAPTSATEAGDAPANVLQSNDVASSSAEISPASEVDRNWRRPAAWSLLAVAAALLLMFVDRNRREERPVAVLLPAEKDADAAPAAPLRKASPLEKTDETARRDGVDLALKNGLADAPADALAKSSSAAGMRNETFLAGRTMPTGHQFSMLNSVPAATQPAVQSGAAAQSGFLPQANLAGAAPEPQTQLAQQVLGGAGVGGYALPNSEQVAAVDLTPLIQSNDYQRARTLVNEYEIVRQEAGGDRETAAALSRRLQSRIVDQQVLQRQVTQSAKGGDASEADRILIVQCDVTPEALEQGWSSILQRQQIADLTNLYADTTTISGDVRREAAQYRPQDGAVDEEFVYVVADAKQLEATLDSLRRQSEYFLNVRVEPAPTDERQQAWRARYSRVAETSEYASTPSRNAPTTSSPAPAGPAAPVVAAAPSPPAGLKAAEGLEERQSTLEKDSPTQAKSEVASSDREREAMKLRAGDQPSSGGGKAVAAAPSLPVAPPSSLPGTYGNLSQSVAPLSRSQRLSRFENVAGRANVAPAATSEPQPAGKPAADSNFAQADKKAPPVPTSSPIAAAIPTASVRGFSATGATAPVVAPAASAPATPTADEKAKDTVDDARSGGAPPGVVPAAAPANRPAEEVLAAKRQDVANGQSVWYGLPPDYHEALFIFRVVNKPNAETKPAAKPTQP